jgi:uncharacterized protein YjiS (DUF1127 family)
MSSLTLNAAELRSRQLPRWRGLKKQLKEFYRRAHSRHELASLDDRELWDIGLTRNDAANEANKPFWEA